jgi:hypothetical protein
VHIGIFCNSHAPKSDKKAYFFIYLLYFIKIKKNSKESLSFKSFFKKLYLKNESFYCGKISPPLNLNGNQLSLIFLSFNASLGNFKKRCFTNLYSL